MPFENILIAGQPLFRSFYVLINYDWSNLALSGLIPRVQIVKKVEGLGTVAIVLISVSVVLALMLAAYYYWTKKRRLANALNAYD